MKKVIYRVALIPALMLFSLTPAYSQETIRVDNEQAIERIDITKVPAKSKYSALANIAPTRFDDESGQTGSTSSANNNGYVFPTAKQRFHRYVKGTVGPFSLLRSAASAGLQQWNDSPDEWGQGMEGYGKRFASNVGSNAVRQTVTYGLSEAFKLDTGFQKSKHTKFWPRVGDALIQNITSRTRSGKHVLSAPILVGVYSSAIIQHETWYPDRYTYKDGLRSGSYSLVFGFGVNLVREFVFNW